MFLRQMEFFLKYIPPFIIYLDSNNASIYNYYILFSHITQIDSTDLTSHNDRKKNIK